MKNRTGLRLVFTAIVPVLFLAGCSTSYTGWQSDVVIDNMNFTRIRVEVVDADTMGVIGYLKEDAEINGYPCRAGWVHFRKPWEPRSFCLSRGDTIKNVQLASGTWVLFHPDTSLFSVVFADDTLFRGYPCLGRGGMNGVQTTFYASGALRQFFPSEDLTVDGVKCKGNVLHPVTLHEKGKLLSCTLNEEITAENFTIGRGEVIRIDSTGRITTH